MLIFLHLVQRQTHSRYPVSPYPSSLSLHCTAHIPHSRGRLKNMKKNAVTYPILFNTKITMDGRGQGNFKSISQVNHYLRDYYEFPISFAAFHFLFLLRKIKENVIAMTLLGIRRLVLFALQTDGIQHSKQVKYTIVPYSWGFSTGTTTFCTAWNKVG